MNTNPFMCRTSSLLEKGQLFRNTLPDQKSILVRYSLTCNAQNLLELYMSLFQYKVYIYVIQSFYYIKSHRMESFIHTTIHVHTFEHKGQTAPDNTKDKVRMHNDVIFAQSIVIYPG